MGQLTGKEQMQRSRVAASKTVQGIETSPGESTIKLAPLCIMCLKMRQKRSRKGIREQKPNCRVILEGGLAVRLGLLLCTRSFYSMPGFAGVAMFI